MHQGCVEGLEGMGVNKDGAVSATRAYGILQPHYDPLI